jgi:O-acetyl-ADP-ribose deacetylase (regulator of RNase III)
VSKTLAKTAVCPKIEILLGDITKLDADAIVNAANTTLLGGGGVDGAIHRAAGPELLAECRTLGGCEPGQAKITRGYDLSARFVIHTVGPIWRGGKHDEARTLADCYRNSLQLAVKNEIKTIAFPAISCGAYGYPIEEAAYIAFKTTHEFLAVSDEIQKVIFVVWGEDVYVPANPVAPSLREANRVASALRFAQQNGTSEKRNRAPAYDSMLYDESERKRSYEGRTAFSAAISATRRRHWLNWA